MDIKAKLAQIDKNRAEMEPAFQGYKTWKKEYAECFALPVVDESLVEDAYLAGFLLGKQVAMADPTEESE